MAITVDPRPLGEHTDAQGAWIMYYAQGTGTIAEVKTAVLGEAPDSFGGFPRQNPDIDGIACGSDGEDNAWEVKVPYGGRSRLVIPPTNSTVWSGDTTGGTQHISEGREDGFAVYGQSGGSVPDDITPSIGATKDGVAGIDIPAPAYAFQATKYIATAAFTAAYRRNLRTLTARLNNAPWSANGDDFAAGEVLFMGATWARRATVDPADWEVNFKFAAKPNLSGADLDPIGTIFFDDGAVIGGWDVVDVTYEDVQSGDFLIKNPLYVKVIRTLKTGDFSLLGL